MRCEEDMKTSVGSISKAARESLLLCTLGHPSLDLWHWSVDPVGQAGRLGYTASQVCFEPAGAVK